MADLAVDQIWRYLDGRNYQIARLHGDNRVQIDRLDDHGRIMPGYGNSSYSALRFEDHDAWTLVHDVAPLTVPTSVLCGNCGGRWVIPAGEKLHHNCPYC